jgi:hypothetical protein
MFTKTAIALAIILATATGALAATKKSNTDMTLDNGRVCCTSGDAWDQLRQRNGFPSWAQ